MRTLVSVAPDFVPAATLELRRATEVDGVRQIGEDALLVSATASPHEIAALCRSGRLRFIRHVAAVAASRSSEFRREDPDRLASWVLDSVTARLAPGDEIGLHVWDSGQAVMPPSSLRHPLLAMLAERETTVRTSGAARTLAVCFGDAGIVCGITDAADALVDWPGGRIRLARRRGQVSRAEFKLEELIAVEGLDVGGVAIDLGASPGGWTRVLLERGATGVIAVDPGDLDPRLASDGRIEHHRTTAGSFLAAYQGPPVDLVVNDMKMSPEVSARTMVSAAPVLAPEGRIVMTLKLGVRHAVDEADRALAILAPAYRVSFVRQLQHNRHELTVVARKR